MHRALIVITAFALSACASTGVQVSEDQTAQIRKGVSTEADVRKLLGPPTGTGIRNGQRMLFYTGAHHQTRASTFIPIVGMFAGGTDTRMTRVEIAIDAAGKVADVNSHHEEMGTSMFGTTPRAPIPDQPR